MNVECDASTLEELTSAFRFNDAVLRNLVVNMKKAVTETSPLAKREDEGSDDRGSDRDAGSENAE